MIRATKVRVGAIHRLGAGLPRRPMDSSRSPTSSACDVAELQFNGWKVTPHSHRGDVESNGDLHCGATTANDDVLALRFAICARARSEFSNN